MEFGPVWAMVPTAASALVYAFVIGLFAVAMRRERREDPPNGDVALPRVTICKPLAGDDDDLGENLESFARIDYPAFEILLGVASAKDPALEVARGFIARHPEIDARLCFTEPGASLNPKVAQLIGLEREATGDVLVISDSNVRVSPGYLHGLVRELLQPRVRLVTSVFAGTGERSMGAAMENLQLGTFTAPIVVAASLLPVRPLTIGKSMAMWRDTLTELGGLQRVGGVLAEDHALGTLFMDAGHQVGTCLEVVENRNVDCTLRRTLERHTRWAKIRRAVAPLAFALEPLLSPVLVATVCAAAHPSRATAAALLLSMALQVALAWLVLHVLRGHALPWRWAPLEIGRAYLVFFCWLRACFSRRVEWRGHAFTITRGSALVPAPPSSWSRIRAAVRA
jgi:ceramide glucosyltransferase